MTLHDAIERFNELTEKAEQELTHEDFKKFIEHIDLISSIQQIEETDNLT